MRRILERAVILMGTLGFWGFIYPELCITESAYETEAAEEPAGQDEPEEPEGYQDVYDFLNGKYRIKLKAVEYLYQVRKYCGEYGG